MWNPSDPSVVNMQRVHRTISRNLHKGDIVRLGGMTDCFQPIETKHRATLYTIEELNKHDVGYLIVTKSALVAHEEYTSVMRKDLAHIQVSLTHTTDFDTRIKEGNASQPSARIAAIEKLQDLGFDVQVRLSPYIPEFVDMEVLNNIKCDKILVEFLRVNSWIKKWLDIDYSEFTIKQGGYQHLPLERKIELLKPLKFKQISVCEDEDTAYDYWRGNVNNNPDDCCNLRK